jgi:Fe-S oxidoreductase
MTNMSEMVTPMLEATELVEEAGGDTVRTCYQCGTCTATCPHGRMSDYRVRDLLRLVQLGLEGYEGEQLWRCTTCNLCVDRCPRNVEIVEVITATRRLMSEAGSVPGELAAAMGSIASVGNPWSGEPDERFTWSKAIPLPQYEPSMDVLLFFCCTVSYDPRSQVVGEATLRLLKKAGVSFGVEREQQCCGESARKSGREDLFETLRDKNSSALVRSGAKRIVTTSPHCHHTLRKEYPSLEGGPEVVHIVTLLRELIDAGRLKPSKPIHKRITYHDPCYLGRHAGLYDDAREVLKAIPGVELVEMRSNREASLCCGGGGGGMWLDRKPEERLSVARWKQADEVDAQTIATACPYCTLMLEDGKTVMGRDDTHLVVDVIQLLNEAIV